MYKGGEKKNNYYVRKKIHHKACNGSKHRNFNACDKKSSEFVLQKDTIGLPVIRETIPIKALKLPTSLNIPQQAVKATEICTL
jgi:hypothetical protein